MSRIPSINLYGGILASLLLSLVSFPSLQAQPTTASGRNASPAAVKEYIVSATTSEPMHSAILAVHAKKIGGEVLVSHNSHLKLIPASNNKLVTTGLALRELGADFTYETSVGFSGKIVDGVLHGDLYIVGGADPTLFSDDSIAVETDKVLGQWVAAVRNAGIKSIEGRVVGDGRYFDGPLELDTWYYQDLGTYYGTGGNGLCFYRNVQDIYATPGKAVGDSVSFKILYPETPWMKYDFIAKTGEAGTGDNLYLYNTDLAPVAQMRGTFAVDRKPRKEECSNKFGALTVAHYLRRRLAAVGIPSIGIADVDSRGQIRTNPGTWETAGPAAAVEDLKMIHTLKSPSLERIGRMTNFRSDNFYAETLLRTLSKKATGSACYDSTATARDQALLNIGIDRKTDRESFFADGSGLSRDTYVSPGFMCRFLEAMARTDSYETYLSMLQQPGQGSYSSRLRNESTLLKQRIFMKSGNMTGVKCYSGYILPRDPDGDTIVFSIMLNNWTGPDWQASSIEDKIIAMIAGLN